MHNEKAKARHHAPSMTCILRDPCYGLMYRAEVARRLSEPDGKEDENDE